ncbi:sugar ABC transporter ATP-binding protein [Rubinisphaera margarita]|uniref:sugar ABC transporter ATP-binding protein n=1 Tax=Rubinisphaera margarita TaxID=2909586 RepID=UPI001EE8EE9B|nr:sugar ABC transporter ATP-binding protein [Rubinisphaera margarita]MCG6156778.1 sugar ABC transporter ATP-binding protein [Rubinisphaera margarita]
MTSAVPAAPPATRLQAKDITKRFPGVTALDHVDLHVAAGEVLAVVGENGAGKSTLMKILAGVQSPDVGQLLVDGQPVEFRSVDDALDVGIALIHQELNLSDNLDVAANIFLGREPNVGGWIRRKELEEQSREHLRRVGLDVSPRTLVRELPIGQQQLVEIAKALSINARVLIMDEPTSSLSQRETESLMQVIDQLRQESVSILYISHRLGEIQRMADRVTVLRDGRNAGELERGEITHDAMVSRMVGRDVSRFYQRHSHTPGEVALQVKGVMTTTWPGESNSLTIKRGEIVGLAGLVGAGRSELLHAIFGVDPVLSGSIQVDGHPLAAGDVRESIRAGLALVPEDRKQQGLILEMTIRENVSLPSLTSDAVAGCLVNRSRERSLCDSFRESLGIRMAGREQLAGLLSGGNQQKVVLAKWLALKPGVLLLDEPTRGIDIGAKEEIYRLIDQLASEGVAILFASSEMEEIIGLSDRVLVMREGRITGEVPRDKLSETAVMDLATA